MNRQNHKCESLRCEDSANPSVLAPKLAFRRVGGAIIFAIFMIPSLLFAQGGNSDDDFSGHRRGRGGDFFGHDRGRGGDFFGHHWEEDSDFFGHHWEEGSEFFGHMRGIGGVFVSEVEEGSPAARAGLSEGDIVLSLNGERVFALRKRIQELSPGDAVTMVIARFQKENSDKILPEELSISITLGANEEGLAYAGIRYLDFGSEKLRYYQKLKSEAEQDS